MISKSAKMKGPQNTPKFLFNEYPRHTMKNTFYSFTVLQFYSSTVPFGSTQIFLIVFIYDRGRGREWIGVSLVGLISLDFFSFFLLSVKNSRHLFIKRFDFWFPFCGLKKKFLEAKKWLMITHIHIIKQVEIFIIARIKIWSRRKTKIAVGYSLEEKNSKLLFQNFGKPMSRERENS